MTQYAAAHMPPRAPLEMVRQDFGRSPAARQAISHRTWREHAWRFAAFGPALALTAGLSLGIAHWLGQGGVTVLEAGIVSLVALTFVWISLSVSVVTLGAVRYAWRQAPAAQEPVAPLRQRVAILVPVYNETPSDVFGNASAMIQDLVRSQPTDAFDLFVLSDTRDSPLAALEERAFAMLQAQRPQDVAVYYRRRIENTDKKVGNITDWIENWGAAYDAMLVLDADSLMSGRAIRLLARELAADPQAGLIQSFPALIGAETLFGRMQQFANAVYGWLLAEGLAMWSQREGNYWGHNAIIRVKSFAESAHLPHLKGRGGRRDLILSHDFVEAGLLRRAGWAVRFLPSVEGSFEETPQTLIDYALRDRRWCQGNLQHLRLLTARGFHPVSRFHLLQGAVAFLLSPAWFALILIWSVASAMPHEGLVYFDPANPLYPIWPKGPEVSGMVYLAVIYAMLLMPKVLGTVILGLRPRTRAVYGGWGRFIGTALFEIGCSILYAPVMMMQQTIAVLRAVLGLNRAWIPQNRSGAGYGWNATVRFHVYEVLVGLALSVGIGVGAVSLWVLPVAGSLLMAPVLSKLSAVRVVDGRLRVARLDAPQDLRQPLIVRRARQERAWMDDALKAPASTAMAAE